MKVREVFLTFYFSLAAVAFVDRVNGFLSLTRSPSLVRGVTSSCKYHTYMSGLESSASPVNTAASLQRTTELSLGGEGMKKKIALLGSTVRQK